MKKGSVFLAFICLLFACQPQTSTKEQSTTPAKKPKDSLAPSSNKADALTEQLHTATIATTSLDSAKMFYVDAMGMSMEKLKIEESTKATQRQLWKIPEDIDWETYLIHRLSVPELIKIRLMLLNKATPSIHKSWSSRELGPFSLGFPNMNQARLDQELRAKGYTSMAAMQEGRIPRPDGTSYRYVESIYKAPEFLHAVGIERKDGMPQLAPVDSLTEKGGPGYSAMVLEDSDAFLAFLTEVLGLELRSDRHWKSSPGSALGIEEGVPFRFSLVYAKGASHNHLLFLDYEDDRFIPLEVEPRIPNQGLGMWTFPTKNIEEVKKNALAHAIEVVHGPVEINDPILGKKQVMTLLAPNGFLVELFQK